MFGFGDEPKPKRRGVIDDDRLVQAVRQRLLRDLQAKNEAHQVSNVINNNQYGGHGAGGGGGLMGAMNGAPPPEDPSLFDYLVDIEKRDIPGEGGGKPVGWTKRVHRHRDEKGKTGE